MCLARLLPLLLIPGIAWSQGVARAPLNPSRPATPAIWAPRLKPTVNLAANSERLGG